MARTHRQFKDTSTSSSLGSARRSRPPSDWNCWTCSARVPAPSRRSPTGRDLRRECLPASSGAARGPAGRGGKQGLYVRVPACRRGGLQVLCRAASAGPTSRLGGDRPGDTGRTWSDAARSRPWRQASWCSECGAARSLFSTCARSRSTARATSRVLFPSRSRTSTRGGRTCRRNARSSLTAAALTA